MKLLSKPKKQSLPFGWNFAKISIEDIAEDQIIFYDIETDHQYAPYCQLKKLGVKYGFDGPTIEVKSQKQIDKFKEYYGSPNVLKVGFNNRNFDDIVLVRNGYIPHLQNLHDGFLMMKCISHGLPSYSLKYLNFHFVGDFHEPERELNHHAQKWKWEWTNIPDKLMSPYLVHDLIQHRNIFQLAWDIVQKEEHWESYMNDLSQGPVIEEMTLEGKLYLDRDKCVEKIEYLHNEIHKWNNAAYEISDGEVTNANSSKQVGSYLDTQGFELALTSAGEFQLRKQELVDLLDQHPIAQCTFNIRKANGNLKYFENYLQAIDYERRDTRVVPIPVSYSISGCSTRRYLSSSFHKLNFQNPNEEAKSVQIVPDGWLGWWIDSTQIENVVHIYESEDEERRKAYEKDSEWSEYVWLANKILGTNLTKKGLENIVSPRNPSWSIYKEFKTAKLALNFGMGISKYCITTGVDRDNGYQSFSMIHEACPAIHYLQEKVGKLLKKNGFVTDVFGYRYTSGQAYKAVAYLIQGCGTAALPKAHLYSNFKTIHKFDDQTHVYGRMQTTTHDENSGRLNLNLGFERIYDILKELMYNMTDKFSPKFDGIPLRAKLYLSRTTAKEHKEIKIEDAKSIRQFCNT